MLGKGNVWNIFTVTVSSFTYEYSCFHNTCNDVSRRSQLTNSKHELNCCPWWTKLPVLQNNYFKECYLTYTLFLVAALRKKNQFRQSKAPSEYLWPLEFKSFLHMLSLTFSIGKLSKFCSIFWLQVDGNFQSGLYNWS